MNPTHVSFKCWDGWYSHSAVHGHCVDQPQRLLLPVPGTRCHAVVGLLQPHRLCLKASHHGWNATGCAMLLLAATIWARPPAMCWDNQRVLEDGPRASCCCEPLTVSRNWLASTVGRLCLTPPGTASGIGKPFRLHPKALTALVVWSLRRCCRQSVAGGFVG